MKCDRKGCKSTKAEMGYLEFSDKDDNGETYIMQLCLEHWQELRNNNEAS